MQDRPSDWMYRVARGHSNGARRAALCVFILSVLLLPVLYLAFLKAFSASSRGAFAHVLSAGVCVVWLVFSNDIRKFANGERLLNQLKSTDRAFRTIGTLSTHTFARWSTVTFDLVVLAGIGWFAYSAWSG